jgi:hypothetical protein
MDAETCTSPTSSSSNNSFKTNVKEVYFAGSHSNVGGGQFENTNPSLSNLSLRWMVKESLRCGLLFDGKKLADSPIFSPFCSIFYGDLDDDLVTKVNKFIDQAEFANRRLNQNVGLAVFLASKPSDQAMEDALAMRADHLSFGEESGAAEEGHNDLLSTAETLGWNVLERTHTRKTVWDPVQGKRLTTAECVFVSFFFCFLPAADLFLHLSSLLPPSPPSIPGAIKDVVAIFQPTLSSTSPSKSASTPSSSRRGLRRLSHRRRVQGG